MAVHELLCVSLVPERATLIKKLGIGPRNEVALCWTQSQDNSEIRFIKFS